MENEKAASRAASKKIDWRVFRARFRAQFIGYGVFVSALGLIRTLLGQLGGIDGLRDFLEAFTAWEIVYLPLVAVLAAVLAYRAKD